MRRPRTDLIAPRKAQPACPQMQNAIRGQWSKESLGGVPPFLEQLHRDWKEAGGSVSVLAGRVRVIFLLSFVRRWPGHALPGRRKRGRSARTYGYRPDRPRCGSGHGETTLSLDYRTGEKPVRLPCLVTPAIDKGDRLVCKENVRIQSGIGLSRPRACAGLAEVRIYRCDRTILSLEAEEQKCAAAQDQPTGQIKE
jgi:hypothetical protein